MAKSPIKFDTNTLTSALKQVYNIHKNIVADLNAKLDILVDENEKLQAQKSSGMSGECSSCSRLKDMNQRLQETFNTLLEDKEAIIKCLNTKLGKLQNEHSCKEKDTSDNMESSELLQHKSTRRHLEPQEAQKTKSENYGDNIHEESNITKTHSKLQLLRQGKRFIRYLEEVPNPKRLKFSPTDKSSRLDSVKWAAMLAPETEPIGIEKKRETSHKQYDLEEFNEQILIVPETIGLDSTIGNFEFEAEPQDNNMLEQERDFIHGMSRVDPLSGAKNNSTMLSTKVVHLEDCNIMNSHSFRIEESQDPCTQMNNRKLIKKGDHFVVKTVKVIDVGKENGKPPAGLSKDRNQSGTSSISGNSFIVDLNNEALKGKPHQNKLDPYVPASRNQIEGNRRTRKMSQKHAEQGLEDPILPGTEMNQQALRGDKLSETKKNAELSQSMSKQEEASKNPGHNLLQPTSPNSSSSAAPKISPKENLPPGKSKQYNPSVKVRGIMDQNSIVNEQMVPPLTSRFLNDSGDLKGASKTTVGKIREIYLDLNGSMNPDVNLSEILASQTSEQSVRGRQHSPCSNELMNAFDETIAPNSLVDQEEMLQQAFTSPAKSSQPFSLIEDTLKANQDLLALQDSSTPTNHKKSLVSIPPKHVISNLKSYMSVGKVNSDIPNEKRSGDVTNSQKKLSLYNSTGLYDKVEITDDVTDDESIAPSPQASFQTGSQLHCSIPSSSHSFKFSKPNHFFIRSDSIKGLKMPKNTANKNSTNPSSVGVHLVGDDGESLDLQAALEEIDRSQSLHEENLQQSLTDVTSPQKSPKHYSPVQTFEDSFDRVPRNKEIEFPHIQVVRKKNEREKLEGFSCKECYEYYKNSGLPEEEMKQRMNQCSRHRHKFVPPATPEHFWSLGFPDTAEILERSRSPRDVNISPPPIPPISHPALSKMDNETPAPSQKGPRRRRRLEQKF